MEELTPDKNLWRAVARQCFNSPNAILVWQDIKGWCFGDFARHKKAGHPACLYVAQMVSPAQCAITPYGKDNILYSAIFFPNPNGDIDLWEQAVLDI